MRVTFCIACLMTAGVAAGVEPSKPDPPPSDPRAQAVIDRVEKACVDHHVCMIGRKKAEANFRRAGLEEVVTVKVGDARKLVDDVEGPVDLLFVDCGYANYDPIFVKLEKKLRPGALVVADNVGIGARGMSDYLDRVRSKYRSKTEWFDLELPWAKRDAMEVTVIAPPKKQ